VLNYEGPVAPSGTSILLLDSSGSPIPTTTDPVPNNQTGSVSPASGLAPGPYTVDSTTLDASDGHTAQGMEQVYLVHSMPRADRVVTASSMTSSGRRVPINEECGGC
jgi:methionine-rich copper-binding protein CopC